MVERCLAKAKVAGSTPVSRSIIFDCIKAVVLDQSFFIYLISQEKVSMKSIMQEGSSVVKAVEKAWEAAGKPKEFSVKVFEEAQKNFLGLTTKSAKIAIFFDGKIIEPEKVKALVRNTETPKKKEAPKRKEKESEQKASQEPKQKKEQVSNQQQGVIWNDQMISFTAKWLEGALAAMGMEDTNFELVTDQYQLKINLDKPLHEDPEKERALFKNFSLFIIQALRHKFHRPLRGFFIVFGRN